MRRHATDPVLFWLVVTLAVAWIVLCVSLALSLYLAWPEDVASNIPVTPTPTIVLSPTPTPPPTPMPIQPAAQEPVVVTEVASIEAPPPASHAPAIRSGNLAALPIPSGTSVVYESGDLCTYRASTHEVVMVPGCVERNRVHELCHAHQHWTINGGGVTRIDLSAWHETGEASSFRLATEAEPWPYTYGVSTKQTLLEDFAEACALWYTDAAFLASLSPARYRWAVENLP